MRIYVAPVMTVELVMAAAAKTGTSENSPETELEVRISEMRHMAGAVLVERELGIPPFLGDSCCLSDDRSLRHGSGGGEFNAWGREFNQVCRGI